MAGFDGSRPVLAGFGPAGGLWGRGKSNGPRADGAVKYRMGPWAPVMPWGIEWAPGPGPGPPLCRAVSNGPRGQAPGPRYAVVYRMGPRAGPRAPHPVVFFIRWYFLIQLTQ